jgi:hypothetical protein
MIGGEKENGKRSDCWFGLNCVDSLVVMTMKHLLIEKGEKEEVAKENYVENNADTAVNKHFNVGIRHSVD